MRLQYLESMYRSRQEDVAVLAHYLGLTQNLSAITFGGSNGGSGLDANVSLSSLNKSTALFTHIQMFTNMLDGLSPEAHQLLKNASRATNPNFSSTASLRLPTASHFLPHLLDDSGSLKPALLLSRGRTGVSIVLGVPTVHREKQSYLVGTLQNLIANMDEEECNDTLIIVFIGEADLDSAQLVAKHIEVSLEP